MKLLVLGLILWAGVAGAACRQALVLGLDVSGSVDALEYRQQLDGLAAALNDSDVRQALFAMPGAPVDLAVFEWSSPEAQRTILPWTTLDSADALDAAIARLHATRRTTAPPTTGLGAAMLRGAAMLAERPGCWRRVLDVSADGISNVGPRPQDVRNDPLLGDMTVNGLVVGSAAEAGAAQAAKTGDLIAYFDAWVTQGPGAFTEVAYGYGDYGRAMRRKLLRELQILAVSHVE